MSRKLAISCVEVKESSDARLAWVEATYNDSFPESERRDFSLVRRLLEEQPAFKLYLALVNEEQYVGFITFWHFGLFVYVEHFAIDSSVRNGGLGSLVMKEQLSLINVPVVLEVELPDEELNRRRIGFYERLGFVLDDHPYRQPPYRRGEEWLDMRLMTCGKLGMEPSFEEIKKVIYKEVYNVN